MRGQRRDIMRQKRRALAFAVFCFGEEGLFAVDNEYFTRMLLPLRKHVIFSGRETRWKNIFVICITMNCGTDF